MAQDHLFTILLLLPVDSILCFAMACKKFRALTASDTLWESICRRDWGPKSVEALKASNFHHQLPWMRLYKQVSRLDSVYCHKLSNPDGELVFPSPRASHSLNFVSDCLVLFGGGSEGGQSVNLVESSPRSTFLLFVLLVYLFMFQDEKSHVQCFDEWLFILFI